MIKLQRYVRVISFLDILLFSAVIIASTITENYICESKPIPIPFLRNGAEEFRAQKTIWDYRRILLSDAQEYGPEAYHSVYILLLLVALIYGIMEVWLFCLLSRAVKHRRADCCIKWITWRVLILAATLTPCALHMSQLQMTCTEGFVVPFCIIRIIFIIFVWRFSRKLVYTSSNDSIIMTGSEKL